MGRLIAAVFLVTAAAGASDYGRVSGTVADPQGNPVVGATVLITGPLLPGITSLAPGVARILSDATGKFTAEHLLPGYYSLRVTSPSRVPATRSGVRVLPGETVQEKFVLSDIFASIRFQPPTHSSTLSEDWKWVLRTSASTRPVLRFKDEPQISAGELKPPQPPAQRLIGVSPGPAGREADADPGMDGVVAYLAPLSADSDLTVAGSLATGGTATTSLATSFRRGLNTNHPQEMSLAVLQMGFGAVATGAHEPQSPAGFRSARGLTSKYESTIYVSHSVTVTSGLDVVYLEAQSGVGAARPHAAVEYTPDASTTFLVRFGSLSVEGDQSLQERVALLGAFPQVTLRGNRAQLAAINHSEAGLDRKLGKSSWLEIAAYRDGFANTGVRGFGETGALAWLAGDLLADPLHHGFIVNVGNYQSTGVRAMVRSNLGSHFQAALVYESGTALAANSVEAADHSLPGNLREALTAERSESVAGKVTARLPVSKTEIVTSYQWMQRGRVTTLDPYEMADLQLDPFLGVQIRQPLPTLAFLPARVEALADFRNLLAQGYVPVSRGGEQLTLTPAYRSFRGGFSVEF